MLEMPMIPFELFTFREYIHANNLVIPFLLLNTVVIILLIKSLTSIIFSQPEKSEKSNTRFAIGLILFITGGLIALKAYLAIAAVILLIAFYRIVLCNKRYEHLKEKFYELF